uniref:M polyprotein n=3 Tax=Tacheng Tick Virus 1 TaxID=1608083 RepID=A0A5C0C9B1_9VIRU|nr:glycoprotein precursor [Tacheng Tick Virus 1]
MAKAILWEVFIFIFFMLTNNALSDDPSSSNSSSTQQQPAANATTVQTAKGSILESAPELLGVSLQFLRTKLSVYTKDRVMRFINTSLMQTQAWGSGLETVLNPILPGKWEALKVVFDTGRRLEQVKSLVRSLNASGDINGVDWSRVPIVNTLVDLTVDGLGWLNWSQITPETTGSVYMLQKRHSGVQVWPGMEVKVPSPQCSGTRTVTNQAYTSFNVEVQYDSLEPIVVLAYATSYLGIDINNCPAVVEHHGRFSILTDKSSFVRPSTTGDNKFYPVIHVSFNQAELKTTCSVVVCSIRESYYTPKGQFKESTLERIEFAFTPASRSTGQRRRLLADMSSMMKLPCSSGTKVITAVQYQVHTVDRPVPGPFRSFCNRTKILNSYAPPDLGCYSTSRRLTKVQCPTRPEHVTREAGDCSYTRPSEPCPSGYLCISVQTPGRGIVKLATEKQKHSEDCSKSCNFKLEGYEGVLTCPNGEKHALFSSEMQSSCLLSNYGKLPLWVCRMSFRPVMVYLMCAWYLLGYAALRVAIFAACILLRCLSSAIKKARVLKDDTRGSCEHCKTFITDKYHWQRHDNCRNGRCPYCRTSCSAERLPIHAKECNSRTSCLIEDEEAVTVKLVPCTLRVAIVWMSSMSKMLGRAAWVLGLFIIFYICVHPVSALKDTGLEEDLWEKEVEFVQFCDMNCFQSEEECICAPEQEGETFMVRKPLSLFPHKEELSQLSSSKGSKPEQRSGPLPSQKRVIDVTTPWGALHVDDAYKPSYSGNHISLSWTEVSSSDDHVTVNGKSQAILSLETGTGAMWEITSPKSSESRRVFVTILDHTQVYNTRFLYATGDRVVESWMHGRCTGDCPTQCGCTDHFCHQNQYDDFTNWRCNPTWCWSIGSGCACCALGIKALYKDWFVSKWEVEYVESPVIACIETSPEDRICQEVSAGVTLQLGPISVQFSDPSGITNRLPREIGVFHKTPSLKSFDIARKVKLVDAKTMCDIQSCTHGPVGDIQFYDVDPLFSGDHINLNSVGAGKGLNSSNSWTSWSGVTSFYTCHPGHWPDCHSTGVVQQNSEAFQNLWNTGDVGVNYHFHSEKLSMATSPTLTLKGRPSYGAGQITALLEVQGLKLKSLHVKPEGLHLDISGCHGCYGCSTGFLCSVRVKITHPDQYAIHLQSEDPNVIAPGVTLMARADSTPTYELHFFSAVKTEEVCLRVKELDAEEKVARSCSAAQLSPQENVALEHRRTLHSTSNSTCTTGYWSCYTSNVISFFSSLGGLLKTVFGGIVPGVISFIIILLLVALLIIFGPNIFRAVIACCRAKRSYRRLMPFEELKAEWSAARRSVQEEKQRNQEAQALLEKLSKVK